MKMKKWYLIPLLILIVLIICFVFFKSESYSYSLEKEEESVVNQYRLYVNDENGNHIDGKVDITYLNGKKQTIEVSKNGKLIIKSVIKKIDNPKRR